MKRNIYFVGAPKSGTTLLSQAVFAELKIMEYDYDLIDERVLTARRMDLDLSRFQDINIEFALRELQREEERDSLGESGFVSTSLFNSLANVIFAYTAKYGIELGGSNPLAIIEMDEKIGDPDRRTERRILDHLVEECKEKLTESMNQIVMITDPFTHFDPAINLEGLPEGISLNQDQAKAHSIAVGRFLEAFLERHGGSNVLRVNGSIRQMASKVCRYLDPNFRTTGFAEEAYLIDSATPEFERERFDLWIYGPHCAGKTTLATKLCVELGMRNWNYGLSTEIGRSLRRKFGFENFSSAAERFPFMHMQQKIEDKIAEFRTSRHGIITCTPSPISFRDGAEWHNSPPFPRSQKDDFAIRMLTDLTDTAIEKKNHLMIHIVNANKRFAYRKDPLRRGSRKEAMARDRHITEMLNQAYNRYPGKILRVEGTTNERIVRIFCHLRTMPQFQVPSKELVKSVA